MPFLIPEMNNTSFVFSPIPYNIYQLIEIYSCAQISDNPSSRDLIPVPLTLTISWEKTNWGQTIIFFNSSYHSEHERRPRRKNEKRE